MTNDSVRDAEIRQKLCEYDLGTSLDSINSILG